MKTTKYYQVDFVQTTFPPWHDKLIGKANFSAVIYFYKITSEVSIRLAVQTEGCKVNQGKFIESRKRRKSLTNRPSQGLMTKTHNY